MVSVTTQSAPAIERGQYALDIDYRRDPEAPLYSADAKWADALLKKAGLRAKRKVPRKRKRS